MRCHDIRECLDSSWESEVLPEVREHVAECAACERYLRDLNLVRAGFRVLKREPVPEPSGFAERLVRQLAASASQPSVSEFFEQIGRRFVYTTLVLTILTLMALVLPSSGPVREQQAPTELLVSAQEATLTHTDLLGDSLAQDVSDMAGGEVSAPAVTK